MEIEVNGLGKRYQKEWIFRGLSGRFETDKSYAITGPNGSGKSTLLQLLTGFFPPTEGQITYRSKDYLIPAEQHYRFFDIITPYLEIMEEFTLKEFLSFHFKFKQLKTGYHLHDFLKKVYLEKDADKLISNFSSGMKQRLKLGLAFFSESPITFLDEPTANLDEKGVNWYLENMREILNKKLVFISSNQKHEYDFCSELIHIPDYKSR